MATLEYEHLNTAEVEAILCAAEDAIEQILIELEDRVGRKISHVTVDTRSFANYDCEITLRTRSVARCVVDEARLLSRPDPDGESGAKEK